MLSSNKVLIAMNQLPLLACLTALTIKVKLRLSPAHECPRATVNAGSFCLQGFMNAR